jgi:hypothetical protein
MSEMVVKRMGELTWKSRRKNRVRAATLERRPSISAVRKVNVEEGNSGDPRYQPRDHHHI